MAETGNDGNGRQRSEKSYRCRVKELKTHSFLWVGNGGNGVFL